MPEARPAQVPPSSAGLDLSLLRGFTFRCRPDCGLCCFTSPACSASERSSLIRIEPAVPFVEGSEPEDPAGFVHVASQGDGGACHFLRDLACRAYSARPFPCRSFPILVHLTPFGSQATLVLSCPGLDLAGLEAWATSAVSKPLAVGLEEELRATEEEWARREGARRQAELALGRRSRSSKLRRSLDAFDWSGLRSELLAHLPMPEADDFPVALPPGEDEPLDTLPLFFEEGEGRVAMRSQNDGWELLTLREAGGEGEVLGNFPAPSEPPRLDPGGDRALRGYLGYVVRRAYFPALVVRVCKEEHEDDPDGWSRALLRELGAQVLTRAGLRARLTGQGGDRLGAADVLRGVRAVDADFLDQPIAGEQL